MVGCTQIMAKLLEEEQQLIQHLFVLMDLLRVSFAVHMEERLAPAAIPVLVVKIVMEWNIMVEV